MRPLRRGVPPLDDEAVATFLELTPEWTRADKRITRTFTFTDFVQAMAFVNRVADVAESDGHHPDIHIHWNTVRLELWTHAIGGLSENDFIVAAKVDALKR